MELNLTVKYLYGERVCLKQLKNLHIDQFLGVTYKFRKKPPSNVPLMVVGHETCIKRGN